jgi:hypothetical protein
MVDVTSEELRSLVCALRGFSKPGKGSHEKMTIPALLDVSSLVKLSNLVDPRLASQTATVTPGKEGYIPPYQIEQIREKFMSLGYFPASVSVTKK